MSKHSTPTAAGTEPVTLKNGLEALQSGSEFHGPVESLDDHHCNDHFAHIYETSEEKFAAAVPFVRHGLKRDERVMYVVDESSEAEVEAALRDGGVDVDAALESGALSFHTVQETYLRNDSFEPDEMIDFYGETVAETTDEYAALRIVAETTWLQDDATTVEQFMEYEAKINELFAETDSLAMCQYDRDGFSPEIVRNIVQTHPHLIYDSTVCHNFYYTPPAEFFGEDEPARENDRMLRTLRDRTEAKAQLRQRERFLEDLYEITADSARSFEERIRRLLELGSERFGLEVGYFTRTDGDTFEIVEAVGDHEEIQAGVTDTVCDTYCEKLLASAGRIDVTDAAEVGWTEDDPAYEQFGLDAYFATTVHVGGEEYGTLCFASETPRDRPYTDAEQTFLDLMGQWIEYELERRRRERFLHESYQITSDPDRSFEEKLQALFELGCERFGLEFGFLNRVDPAADRLEIEYASGDHEHYEVGDELPLSETYCQAAADLREATSIADPAAEGYDDRLVYEDFGVDGYFGTYIPVEGGPDRTLAFVPAEESRVDSVSEQDRTYLELLGQWVGYELNRRQRERFLRKCYETTADPGRSFEEKLHELLDLAREWMGLDVSGLTHLPERDGAFLTEYAIGYGGDGVVDASDDVWTEPGEGCYCRQAIESDEPVGKADVRGTDWEDDTIYQEQGLSCYLGVKVTSGSAPYGTLWVGSTQPRDREFSKTERTFLELMGQWVSYELERREHKRSQRELSEITADPDLATDEKIQRLLEVGCERLGLPVGMLNRDRGDALEIRQMHGTHPDMCEGDYTPPSSDHYCQQVLDVGESVAVADAGAAGWDGDPLYDEAGLETYAGMRVAVGGDAYGTLCFADTSPRETEFTETERSFLELMGQCVGYELERSQREARLHALSTLGRELLDAETPAEVADRAIGTVEDTMASPVAAVAFYDSEAGDLRLAASTDAAAEVPIEATLARGDGVGWDAFVSDSARRATAPFDDADGGETTAPHVSEVIAYPLGNHGVYVAGARGPNGFRHDEVEVMQTAVANVRAALDRADREQQLQEREATLEEQNQTLERLNRINDTIRRIDQALVEASTREEIERVVCEELADVGPYELAWIGDDDEVTGEVTFRESAGAEKGYLDSITITTDDSPEGCGPGGRAVKTGEPQVINDVLTDDSFEPWRQEALNRGYHAVAALPLVYEDTRYGVLTLYAGQPGMFDDLEREVLTELSATIAHAINAVESKKALISDEVTELTFTVTDRSLAVVELARELECEFSLKRLVPQSGGEVRAFFSVRGASADDVLEFGPRLAATDLNLVSDPDDDPSCLFEATLSEGSLSRTVLDHGGRLRTVDVENGTATVVVHLAADADIREFVEMFQSKYPDSELDAQRTMELPQRTSLEFAAELTDALTDRQAEILQTAYFSGYFDEPRTRNASELAESMEITQPTFTSHLRTALRKLCRQIYETEPAKTRPDAG